MGIERLAGGLVSHQGLSLAVREDYNLRNILEINCCPTLAPVEGWLRPLLSLDSYSRDSGSMRQDKFTDQQLTELKY